MRRLSKANREAIENEVKSIYEIVNTQTPNDVSEMHTKYDFTFIGSDEDSGGSAQFYRLEGGLGGVVAYRKDEVRGIELQRPVFAFDHMRKRYINHHIGLKLGFALPGKLEFVLAEEKNSGDYFPMIVSEDVGDLHATSSALSPDERKISAKHFKAEVRKVLPYLSNGYMVNVDRIGANDHLTNRVMGPDLSYENSRWDSVQKKAYLIDPEKWKFRGVSY